MFAEAGRIAYTCRKSYTAGTALIVAPHANRRQFRSLQSRNNQRPRRLRPPDFSLRPAEAVAGHRAHRCLSPGIDLWQPSCPSISRMLKITLHDSARAMRFQLAGELSGIGVRELRQSWQTGSSTTAGRSTIVDLTEVQFVDAEGESLLEQMHQEGVRLVAAEEFCPRQGCATIES